MINVTRLYNALIKGYSLVPYHLLHGYSLPPVQYLLYVTRRCNLRCSFCFFEKQERNYDRRKLMAKELTTSEIWQLIRGLPKFGVLTITGGEPFLRPDIIDILEYAARRRSTHVISNGTLIRNDYTPRLIGLGSRSLIGKGLVLIGISLPGTEERHPQITGVAGAYERTISIVKSLVAERRRQNKRFPLINLKTVISPQSLNDLPKLYQLASELGVDIFNVLAEYALPVSRDSVDYDLASFQGQNEHGLSLDTDQLRIVLNDLHRLAKNLKPQLRITPSQVPIDYLIAHYSGAVKLEDYYCHSPWAKVEISPYGDIYPCLEFNAGNIRTQPFLRIWNGSKFRQFRKALKRQGLFEACKGCCNMEHRPRWLGSALGRSSDLER